MSTALPKSLPDRFHVAGAVLKAAVVGATLYALDGSVRFAAMVAVGALLLTLSQSLADAVIGDYAGNALLGTVVLAFGSYAVSLGSPWWFLALLGLCGGWLLLDGVQHRRHGLTRDEMGVPYRHGGSAVTGLPKALLLRLLEPVLLASRSGHRPPDKE